MLLASSATTLPPAIEPAPGPEGPASTFRQAAPRFRQVAPTLRGAAPTLRRAAPSQAAPWQALHAAPPETAAPSQAAPPQMVAVPAWKAVSKVALTSMEAPCSPQAPSWTEAILPETEATGTAVSLSDSAAVTAELAAQAAQHFQRQISTRERELSLKGATGMAVTVLPVSAAPLSTRAAGGHPGSRADQAAQARRPARSGCGGACWAHKRRIPRTR
mmetsp:Transcript_35591/g.111901  ORF Transcript_35591/g.111901 Transcript_35591/m.111901 type:complete len:217 (+) Transcript_35591:521-1171(+)